MNVSKDFEDYSPDDYNLHKRLGRWPFWETLVNVKREHDNGNTLSDADSFLNWLENKYGIKVFREKLSNGITDDYEIVDEQKFLIFLLKYSEKI